MLTHLKAFRHQNVESIGVVLMQNWRNFSQNYSLCEGTWRSGGWGVSLEWSKTCSTVRAKLPWCWMLAMRFPVPFCWHFWDHQWPLSTHA